MFSTICILILQQKHLLFVPVNNEINHVNPLVMDDFGLYLIMTYLMVQLIISKKVCLKSTVYCQNPLLD